MIITIFFAIASISLIIFLPIYLKKKNNLYKYKPQEKMSLKKQKKTIKISGNLEILQILFFG